MYADRPRDKRLLTLMMISYFGNVAAIFGYFFPMNPSGSLFYFGWLTLGYVLGLSRLPKVADTTGWFRIIKKHVQNLRKTRVGNEEEAKN